MAGASSSMTGRIKTHQQDTQSISETADLMESAGLGARPFLLRDGSAPTTATQRKTTKRTQTHPGPCGKVSLPFHLTAQPKEKLPERIPIPPLERMFTGLLLAPRPVGDAPPILGQLRNIATYSWLNLLLVFIPASWAAVSNFPLIMPASSSLRADCTSLRSPSYSSRPILICTLWYQARSHGAASQPKGFLSAPASHYEPHCETDPLLTLPFLVFSI